MKLHKAGTIVLLLSWPMYATTLDDALPAARTHSRDIVKRAGRDCGTFTMFCDNAAGACNNACHHINCVNRATRTVVYDSTNTNNRNRIQSGCETADGNVCNKMPFSQAFHDPLNRTPDDRTINCNEWPMATTRQSDFAPGAIRNSLRCISGSENSSGGDQLQKFIEGTNARGAKRTCSGSVQDGDFWTIAFDTSNTPASAVRQCLNPSSCNTDPLAFHMTQKNGHFSFPYNLGTDNRYTQDSTGKDLLQCSVTIKRQGNSGFTVTLFDTAGVRKGQQGGYLSLNGQSFSTNGLPQPFELKRTAVYAASGTGMLFTYQSAPPFQWGADTKGSSVQVKADGSYCTVTTIGTYEQDLKCYFPCPAA